MQNYAKVGGILSIVSGAFGVLWLVGAIVLIIATSFSYTDTGYYYDYVVSDSFYIFFFIVLIVVGLFNMIVGILAIIGGAFALKKKVWGLALAGAIAGTITFFPCGIPAIIFTALGKKEFHPQEQPAPTVVNG
jgi:nitrate reductase gamma subunit